MVPVPHAYRSNNAIAAFASLPFHALMLRNIEKYRTIYGFLQRHAQGRRIVDVGAGTGIISALAVKAGADHVVAVERELSALAIMRNWLDRNPHFRDRMTVVHGDWELVRDTSRFFDLAISETVGYFGFEEGISGIARSTCIDGFDVASFFPNKIALRLMPMERWPFPSARKRLVLSGLDPESPGGSLHHVRDSGAIKVTSEVISAVSIWRARRCTTVQGLRVLVSAKFDDNANIDNSRGDVWPRVFVRFSQPLIVVEGTNLHFAVSIAHDPFRATIRTKCDRQHMEGIDYETRDDVEDLVTYPLHQEAEILDQIDQVLSHCS